MMCKMAGKWGGKGERVGGILGWGFQKRTWQTWGNNGKNCLKPRGGGRETKRSKEKKPKRGGGQHF